ncbi:MAG: histone [Thermoprotei archaeon]|nr:MAG: histone [Thermoprotei archaeon]
MRGIPLHSMGRLIQSIEDIRSTAGAKRLLKAQLEEWANKVAERAVVYMNHAGRKTLMKPDVELAIKDLEIKHH